ncbi:MAG: hypothetical protein ACXVPQ_12570 [Bacteroidia bacterium]
MAALGKKVLNFVKKDEKPKESKMHKAFDEFKQWVTSPGGIITLLLFAATIWYVHEKFTKKGKA